MAMAPTVKVVLGSIAFAIFWVLAVFPAVPFLPIGRTAGSLLGAMLMVLFQVIAPNEAYNAIDLPILGLLFGTMVVSVYLENADMFEYLGKLLSWKSRGPKDLIFRICLFSALSSALFTNDTSCVVLTEFVLKIARQHNLPPHPFLLALASSANIGSAATPIGNPQNLVIAIQSKITFGEFLIGILPAMLVGVFVNCLILLCMYWKLLSCQKDEEEGVDEVVGEENIVSHRFAPATLSHCTSINSCEGKVETNSLRSRTNSFNDEVQRESTGDSNVASNDRFGQRKEEISLPEVVSSMTRSRDVKENLRMKWKIMLWKSCVYLVTIGMLISLLMGLNMSWTAITAALALVILDFRDAEPNLEKVKTMTKYLCILYVRLL